jgi:uncharacterized protein
VQADVELLRDTYAAFARRDLPAVLDAFHPDIEWTIPAGSTLGGTHRGLDGTVAEVLMAPPEASDDFRTEPEEYLDAGDTIVVLGAHRGTTRSGKDFEVHFAHVWTMRHGLAIRCRSYVDTARLNAVLGDRG